MLLFLPNRKSRPESVLYSATASFIDTGTEKLIVTCGHVVSRYNELKPANPDIVLAIAGNRTWPVIVSDAELIDNGGKQLDLATLRLADPERIACCGKSYFRTTKWPPIRAQKGQLAIMTGFPGMHREASARGLEVRATPIADFVTSVSDRHIVLVDEDMVRVAVKHNPALSDLVSLGGMSGSAVYVWDDVRQALNLVGFMYEAGEGTHASIFVAHAAYIRANGVLARDSMPW